MQTASLIALIVLVLGAAVDTALAAYVSRKPIRATRSRTSGGRPPSEADVLAEWRRTRLRPSDSKPAT